MTLTFAAALLRLLCGLAALAPAGAQLEDVRWWELVEPDGERFTARDSFGATVFNNSMYVVGGRVTEYQRDDMEMADRVNDVWHSQDGESWQVVPETMPWRERYGHTLDTMQINGSEAMVMTGGFTPRASNDVWWTFDGVEWHSTVDCISITVQSHCLNGAPWTARGFHASAVWRGSLWIAGGAPLNNDIWVTDDAVHWEQAPSPPWMPRSGAALAVFPFNETQTLFLLGGWVGQGLNDVWSTYDGTHWLLHTAQAPWVPRGWHAVSVFDSGSRWDAEQPRLYVMGGGNIGNGLTEMEAYTDVWFTRDGYEWTAVSSEASGESTAEWCSYQSPTATSSECWGKWGTTVLPFVRSAPRRAPDGSLLPGAGVLLNTLYFLAGDAGDGGPKVAQVHRSTVAQTCEVGGYVCNDRGVCSDSVGCAEDGSDCRVDEIGCVCDAGWAGEFCELEAGLASGAWVGRELAWGVVALGVVVGGWLW